jgi:hypothetical protein
MSTPIQTLAAREGVAPQRLVRAAVIAAVAAGEEKKRSYAYDFYGPCSP